MATTTPTPWSTAKPDAYLVEALVHVLAQRFGGAALLGNGVVQRAKAGIHPMLHGDERAGKRVHGDLQANDAAFVVMMVRLGLAFQATIRSFFAPARAIP